MTRSKTSRSGGTTAAAGNQATRGQATRETIESIVVAVILAFLFRAFIAEAFVIPTGSMAPTLMGRHKDVTCEQCGYQYQTGASVENGDESDQGFFQFGSHDSNSAVVATTCPICRYEMVLDLFDDANQASFTGDRILVNKFSYELSEPDRWDVFVFKYPGNAKQNFIKRLVGLPNETIRIRHGDIYIRGPEDKQFRIARRPEQKIRAMLQLVHDSKYRPAELVKAGWPARWQPWLIDGQTASAWESDDDGRSFLSAATGEGDHWLRYHHLPPTQQDWMAAMRGDRIDATGMLGQLITDYYAYNAFVSIDRRFLTPATLQKATWEMPNLTYGTASLDPAGTYGLHWVGDLAVEVDVEARSDQGELLLLLVEGGEHYECRIVLASGVATLTINKLRGHFSDEQQGHSANLVTGNTSVRGPGKYRIRFANVDSQLLLWVDDRLVEFDGPTTYQPTEPVRPQWSPQSPGDAAPLGVGSTNAELQVSDLRVYRDVYYVAVAGNGMASDYDTVMSEDNFPDSFNQNEILTTLRSPPMWATTRMFDARRTREYHLQEDQFLPLGDNSPQSADARLWEEPYVERELLIGKALLIYWPHAWKRPIPFWPNFRRMGLIR